LRSLRALPCVFFAVSWTRHVDLRMVARLEKRDASIHFFSGVDKRIEDIKTNHKAE